MARKKKPPKRKAARRRRAGSGYERVVAEVVRAMDPAADVRQGEWVTGPDGARELDVVITGTVEGEKRTMLIECKDFNPASTGPVGVGHIDGLESKRRDLGVDAAVLCSNAGFSPTAARKAGRVDIGLIGVMKAGDARIRFRIVESLYTRHVQIEKLDVTYQLREAPPDLREIPAESVLYGGVPLVNWVNKCVLRAVAQNPVVRGHFRKTVRLKGPIDVEFPTGAASVESFGFELTIRGAWYVQEVAWDASAGLYDWLRHRVRLVPAPRSHLSIETTTPIPGGDWIEMPPEHVLKGDLVEGEATMGVGFIQGLGSTEPVPDIEARVHPEDLDFVIHDLQPELYTSDVPVTFNLERADGAPADPPSVQTIARCEPGDTIPLGGRALEVVGVRVAAADETPVLIVEDLSERAA